MVAVSVVVATSDPGAALPGLVRSIDAQTLPAADFEVVVVDDSRDGSAERLHQLAGRRRNVTVLGAGGPGALDAAAAEASGEYVLVLTQRQRLAPRALELLLARARETGADVVLGRAVARTSGSATLPDDVVDATGVDPVDCVALVRRSLPGAGVRELRSLVVEAGVVSAIGRSACASEDVGRVALDDSITLESLEHRWEAGALHLSIEVRTPGAGDLSAWFVLAKDLAETAVPATTVAAGRDAISASVVLDPRIADGGGPLGDGRWNVLIRVAGHGREATLPLPAGRARSAVIDGRPYVVHATGGALRLDAGATRTSAIGPVLQSRTTIAESASGILVTLDYPSVHVQGDAVLDAQFVLDGFRLPARLVCREGRAQLESWASSLAGVSAVSVLAGGGKPVPTGLRLRVSGAGAMRFEKAPPPQSERTTSGGRAPLVQRVRRRVPGALEPLARRMVRVPVLRDTYRRLLKRK